MRFSANVHQAARMLFAARLDRMTEVEIEALVNARQKDRTCFDLRSWSD